MVARKRKIISSLRGSKKMKSGTGRRLGSRKRRQIGLKPEVKFTNKSQNFPDVVARDSNYTAMKTGDYIDLITFPSQAQTDTGRIGDTILGKKCYIRLGLTTRIDSGYVRIIIFNMKREINTANDLDNFWQFNIGRQTIYGVVNREIVNKVFYDKVKTWQSNIANGNRALSFKQVNISMKWPIIFAGGGIVPKDPRNTLFIACIGCTPVGTADTTPTTKIARLDVACNFYFTDP